MMRRPYFAAVLLLVAAAAPARAQLTPAKAAASFKVSDGLEISLWASEPLFVNPTCMDVDHRGRVWVVESVNYRSRLRGQPLRRKEGDRILVLEDTKGQGKADKATVFYQAPEILAPLGIAVRPDPKGPGATVYVCQSPDILVFDDKDGDGKADGPPRKLLSGFRGIDHDHGVHGILIGPDDRLYFTVGDAGVQNLQSADKKGRTYSSNGTDIRAATVWRCDLDGKHLELLAHNFRNNYEPCVTSFGDVFLSDNDDDGNQQTRLCYVMRGGNYGYHHNPKVSHWNEEMPGIVPKILRTYFGSPTGICVYEGSLLPAKYRGQLLHTDAGPRHVRCYHLTAKGASFTAEREDMVQSSDNWFRPSDVCVAPDGSVYVADWYDPGVGGHGIGDFTRGRVYRIAPKGSQPSVPRIDVDTTAGLHAALASPNLAVRALAMARVGTMDRKAAVEVLEAAAVQKKNTVLRARALWQLGRIGRLRLVAQAFEDADPRFRILAMRIVHDFHGLTPDKYVADWQKRVTHDPSSAVRREALLLLQSADPEKAAPLIWELARRYDGKDRFYLAAVGIAIGHHDAKRRAVVFAHLDRELPAWSEAVAGLLWELRPPNVVPLLSRRLLDAKLPAEQRALVADVIATSNDPTAGPTLLRAIADEKDAALRERVYARLRQNLAGKWKGLANSPEAVRAIESFLDDPKTRAEGLELAGLTQNAKLLQRIKSIVAGAKESLAIRIAATRALGGFKGASNAQTLLEIIESKGAPAALRTEAVLALSRHEDWNSVPVRGVIADAKGYTLELRRAAAAGLAGSKNGSAWLLDAYSGKRLAADLTPDLARLLRNSPFGDVRQRANKVLPAPPKLNPKDLPSIQALLTRKGNANRGRELMARTPKNDAACLKCHTINGEGGKVGPDLSAIGAKASRENLLESILYPSRAINHQYQTWVIETKGGLVITGIIVEETPTHLVLRDTNTKEYRLERKDIANRAKSEQSIMPDNLILYLPENDLLDLVEYLYGLKGRPAFAPAARLDGREPEGLRLRSLGRSPRAWRS